MRRAAILLTGLMLGACNTAPPNDGDAYFDNITPDPVALAAAEQRLSAAETGAVTVLPPGTGGQGDAQPISTGDISNTQDFNAIKQRESIESDAAKLAALRENYEAVAPEALPQRDDGGINLAAYAISQKHDIGTRVFGRFDGGVGNCGRYRDNPDAAQREFLKAGGPQKDPRGLDPDGDGFACGWNPETYRRLLRASQNG